MQNHLHSLISAAQSRNPTEFKAAFTTEMMSRITDRIEALKPSVVGGTLGLNANASE